LTRRANVPSCPIMQEIATIPQDAASLHGHVPGKLNVLAAKRVTRRNRLVALAGSAAV